ncbi:MAG: hypothetical protein FWE24_09405 [Defluviitaleaceae bacterium]|nr:hypothetical protein [Defluviitaleaceae bacterium]
MAFLEWLYLHNVIISLLLSPILSLILFGISFFFTKRQKPKFFTRSRAIITNLKSEFGELKVFYKDIQITNLTETHVFLWNAGRKSIRTNDLLKATPIVISIPSDIKTYRISYVSTPDLGKTIQFFKSQQGGYELSFDAMQKHDGICIRVLHSGNEENSISVNGKLDGRIKVKEATKPSSDPDDTSFINKTLCNITLSLILLCASIAVAIYASINRLSLELLPRVHHFSLSPFMSGVEANEYSSFLLISIVLLFFAIMIFFNASNSIPNKLIYLAQKHDEYLSLFDLGQDFHEQDSAK